MTSTIKRLPAERGEANTPPTEKAAGREDFGEAATALRRAAGKGE